MTEYLKGKPSIISRLKESARRLDFSMGMFLSQLFVLALICIAWLFMSCSDNSVAGGSGTETTDEYSVSGVVLTSAGEPAGDVKVGLRPADYWPGVEEAGAGLVTGSADSGMIGNTSTDSEGRFTITDMVPGSYRLFASSPEMGAGLREFVITPEDNSREFPDFKLSFPREITGQVIFNEERTGEVYVQVQGLEKSVPVNTKTGEYTVKGLAPGEYDIRVVSTEDDEREEVFTSDVTGGDAMADTLVWDIYAAWSVHATLTIDAAGAGVTLTESLVDFPLLLRLRQADIPGLFSEAAPEGDDLVFVSPSGRLLSYEIETWNVEAGSADIWVRADTIHAGSTERLIKFYAGNPGRDEPLSSIGGPFVFNKSDYLAVWHMGGVFQGDSTRAVSDVSGNGRHLHSFGGMVGSNQLGGVAGPATYFDGVDDFLHRPVDYTGPFTLALWARAGDSVQHKFASMFASNDTSRDYTFQLDIDSLRNQYRFYPDNDNDSLPGRLQYPFAELTLDYQHLAVTFEEKHFRVYHNGDFVLEGDIPYNLSFRALKIGANRIGDFHFKGAIDEVRLASIVMSDDWIKLSYENQKAGSGVVEVTK